MNDESVINIFIKNNEIFNSLIWKINLDKKPYIIERIETWKLGIQIIKFTFIYSFEGYVVILLLRTTYVRMYYIIYWNELDYA